MLARLKNARLALARRVFPVRRFLAKRAGLAGQPHGVNLVGYMRADMGLGQAARGMAEALEAAGIPFNVVDFARGNPASQTDLTWQHKETVDSRYDITLVAVSPDNFPSLRRYLPSRFLSNRYVIGSWYWELPEFPEQWAGGFGLVDEVWAETRFVQDAIAMRSPVTEVRIPPVFRLGPVGRMGRSDFGIAPEKFVFLAMADARSVIDRKGLALRVIQAFKKAFCCHRHSSATSSSRSTIRTSPTRHSQPFATKPGVTPRSSCLGARRTVPN